MSETKEIVTHNRDEIKDAVQTFILGSKLATDLTPIQKDLCIKTAQEFGLNPLKREIHFIKRGNDLTITVGYEVYLKRAESSNKLDGWKVEIQGTGADQRAVATIYRKDWTHPFIHEAYKSEVAQTSPIWQKMPRFMLKKVAIAQAFRLAFPEDMGGLPYMEDELGIEIKEEKEQPITPTEQFTEAEAGAIETDMLEATEDVTPICSDCGEVVTQAVVVYSEKHFSRILCFECQKKARTA